MSFFFFTMIVTPLFCWFFPPFFFFLFVHFWGSAGTRTQQLLETLLRQRICWITAAICFTFISVRFCWTGIACSSHTTHIRIYTYISRQKKKKKNSQLQFFASSCRAWQRSRCISSTSLLAKKKGKKKKSSVSFSLHVLCQCLWSGDACLCAGRAVCCLVCRNEKRRVSVLVVVDAVCHLFLTYYARKVLVLLLSHTGALLRCLPLLCLFCCCCAVLLELMCLFTCILSLTAVCPLK